jgi:hypothetical protein
MKKKLPKEHRMTRDEAVNFMKEKYNADVVE